MKLYPAFLVLASVSILSPGPGVLMTISNAIQRGFREAFFGILGLATGSVVIATFSATSLGVMLAASSTAFAIVKYLGASYLAALAIRNWRASATMPGTLTTDRTVSGGRFAEGILLQTTNPQAIVFFLAVFPQFVDATSAPVPQLTVLVLSFGALLIAIHSCYAAAAHRARTWISAAGSGRMIRRAAGAMFLIFAVVLVCR